MGDNADIGGRVLDVFVRRSFEEAQRLCTPDVEVTTLFGEPGTAEFTGHDGLRRWFDRLDHLWAFIEAREVEVSERGKDWVLITARGRMRGRASPNELELPIAAAIKLRNDKVARACLFSDEAQARAVIEAG